jgi:hypothetical protein
VEQNIGQSTQEYTITHSVLNVETSKEAYTVVFVEHFASERLQHKQEAIAKACQIVDRMPHELTQREKAEYFYDYLGENVVYEGEIPAEEYLYSALCQGKTNCDGYANAFSVLCALAEKLSGKSLFDFLNERIFSHLGTFKTATILKNRNGDSWGPSALICTSRDMASFGRFVLNYGTWNGKRLMNEEYLRKATSCLVSNEQSAWKTAFSHGYGYKIWRTEQDGFAFFGMGDQITIMHPATDTVFVITSDNQGFVPGSDIIVDNYFDYIITHSAPTSVQTEIASTYEINELTEFLEKIKNNVACKKWFFGHYHQDKKFDEKYIAIFDSIYKI